MKKFNNLYFSSCFKNTNSNFKNIKEMEKFLNGNFNNKDILYFNILDEEQNFICVTLNTICYIDLQQFDKKTKLFSKILIIDNDMSVNISFYNEIKELDTIAQCIKSIINKYIENEIIYKKQRNYKFYHPRNHILQVNEDIGKYLLDKEFKKTIKYYIKEYNKYYNEMIIWYEDNANGATQNDLDLIPEPPKNLNTIKIIDLEFFLLNILVKHDKTIKKSQNQIILDINLLLKIETDENKNIYTLEWYIDKILVSK